MKGLAIIFAALAVIALPENARAQALSFNGEEIAGAELMAAAKKEGKIVYYGTYPEPTFKIVAEAFAHDTGLTISYLRLTTQMLFPRVMAENAAGKLEADVVDLTDLTLVRELVEAGVFARAHRTPSFDRLPRDLRDDDGRWYALFRSASTIIVNSALVKPVDYPTSWKDMLEPKWTGRIGLPSIDAGGSSFSNQMFLRDVIAADYWTRLAALRPRVYPSINPAMADLVRGETSVVFGGAESSFQMADQGAPLKVLFPDEGISSYPIAGSIVAVARDINAAKVLLNWLTSRRGAAAIAASGGYASHPDGPAPKPHGATYPSPDRIWTIRLDDWLKKRETYSQEWRDLFTNGR